jgi:AAHS family 4-hydroxybenzoate transporter-like MFS transporter
MSNTTRQIEIGELIDRGSLTRPRLAIVVLCALVVLMDGYDIQTMALAVPSLVEVWGLDSAAFSFALSASVFGMLVGTAVVAPVGDRFGRRPLLIGGMALVGAASIATAFSATPAELVIWRFLTGIGLGASLPNATALTSEYVPQRTRAFLITAMYISIALGALIAGFVAPVLVDAFGWRSIFIVGGVLPLLLVPALGLFAPESVRLLLAQRPNDPRIPAILRRVLPGVDAARVAATTERQIERRNVLALFASEFWARTTLLWLIFALNLFVLFVLIIWLPTILTDAGWARGDALRGAVVIQAGGIAGGLVIARLVDLGRTIPVMIGAYLIVAVTFSLFLVIPATVLNWNLLLLVVGAGVSGSQGALTALSAIFYPPGIRATGAGWASACGRAGAVLAPLAGGLVLGQLSLSPAEHLALLIPPVVICAGCVAVLRYAWNEPGAQRERPLTR